MTSKKSLGLLIWLLCLLPHVFADEDPFANLDSIEDQLVTSDSNWFINGHFESRNQWRLNDHGNAVSNKESLWLNIESEGERFRFYADGYASYEFAGMDGESRDQLEMHEAYLTIDSQWLDLITGRKIVTWGVTSGLSTMDEINPVDANDPLASARAGNKIPVWLLDLQLDMRSSVFSAIFLPRAVNTALPDSGSAWEPEALKEARQLEKKGYLRIESPDEPDEPEWGFRWDIYATNLDLGFVFFDGFENDPFFTSAYSDGTLVLTPGYYRWRGYGVYLTTPGERSAFRMELAYKPDYPFSDKESNINRKDDLMLIAGVDSSFFTNMSASLQLFSYNVMDENRDEIKHPDRYGISYAVENSFFYEALIVGIQGQINHHDSSSFTELFGKYKYQDSVTLHFGIMDFEGSQDSTYGEYHKNDLFYLTLQYYFSLR